MSTGTHIQVAARRRGVVSLAALALAGLLVSVQAHAASFGPSRNGPKAHAALPARPSGGVCRPPRVSRAYMPRVARVLGAGKDVWGERLLSAPAGPTLAAASRFLPPLLYAAGHGGQPLTASGVYYLPLTLPAGVGGERGFGLHVGDGSQIIVRRVGGPSLFVGVGRGGTERFGSCLARLETPGLRAGYLPILEDAYRDRAGVRYCEESFVGRQHGRRSLVSFLRISADARGSARPATILLRTSDGDTIRRVVRPGHAAVLDAAFVHAGAVLERIGRGTFDAARRAVSSFWARHVAKTARFIVPEPGVLDVERALLIQELEMTWRYSVGNVYEELSYVEALDVAQTMAEYGYGDVARQILRFTLRRLPARFTYWRAGERLTAGARYFQLTRDRRYVAEEMPRLRAVVDRLDHEVASSSTGLLPRERYSSDIPDLVYSLQGQTLVWQGLLAMGRVWRKTGYPVLAARCRSVAVRLETGLRDAVRASERRLGDGSLFVPAALLDGGAPFHRLTSSRAATYWNLVVPYALASGFFAPHGPEAVGLLRYQLRHGSRLLGLVRAGAYRLAGLDPSVSGTDQVYGVNMARFLADNDEADQLLLSLYGTVAAALTPGTYVAGEAASVSPLGSALYRTMYLPPNNAGAAAFLETLRQMLVHESRGAKGVPRRLELAFSTPRGWLREGESIVVRGAPTSFGPVSYSIRRGQGVVRVVVTMPTSPAPARVRLRLRLPAGERIASVALRGRTIPFDRRTGTIELSGRAGVLRLTASIESGD
jgi:hypothetical protein